MNLYHNFGVGDDDLDEYEYLFDGDEDDERDERWNHKRIDWPQHVKKLLHEKMFSRTYRMSHAAFTYLCIILRPKLERNHSKSKEEEPITVEMTVGCGIRLLAGGLQIDAKNIFGFSKTETHNTFIRFLDAVNATVELDIRLPATPDEWNAVRKGFMKKSHDGLFEACVGAIDGFFQSTTCPTRKEVGGNVLAYYSGHYESYGLNCQAACDVNLRFLFFGVVAPGKTNDNVAFPRCGILFDCSSKLPIGTYFLGDAAYSLSDRLLIPFTGSQRDDEDNDAYNFYLSQLRIRIEMSFGRLVRKWAILKTKMAFKLKKTSQILQVCAKLHNFVIDHQQFEKSQNGEVDDDDDDENDDSLQIIAKIGAPMGMQYLPSLPNDDFISVRGMSMIRSSVVEKIRVGQYKRPSHNRLRNQTGDSSRYVPTNSNGSVIEEELYHPT